MLEESPEVRESEEDEAVEDQTSGTVDSGTPPGPDCVVESGLAEEAVELISSTGVVLKEFVAFVVSMVSVASVVSMVSVTSVVSVASVVSVVSMVSVGSGVSVEGLVDDNVAALGPAVLSDTV